MNNNQLFPFERNRYYVGKMLTSADFQAEQTYFNNKRRFINNMMFGSGIVCGCGVFSLDDLSVLVESGVAIDGLGREIVLETSVVKKLSAIEGFEKLTGNRATLCLRYREENVHSVYAVNKQEREDDYEYNRISEDYELFLEDASLLENEFVMESEFLSKASLLEDDDYKVEVSIPATVCKGQAVKMVVTAEKLSFEEKALSYKCILQVPAFTTLQDTHEVQIDFAGTHLEFGEKTTVEYWLKAQDLETPDTSVVLKSGSEEIYGKKSSGDNMMMFNMKLVIQDIAPRNLVAREIGKMSLEMRSLAGTKDYICLADIRLVRTDSAYIIEEISEKSVKKYILAPSQEMLRNEYMDYFKSADDFANCNSQENEIQTSAERRNDENASVPLIATGTLEIPLGDHVKKGDIRYSGEIMHGLGKGNVYVEIGYEFFAEDKTLGANSKSTVYGNPELFKEGNEGLSDVETAIKVLNDKGSFVVAAKFVKDIDYLVLTYRWVAIKFPTGNDMGLIEDVDNKSITAETPTVVLGTKESHYFNVKFNNMDSCSIAYEMTEAGSGEITSDGVYTAPSKEGVYEIRIYCTDMPIICTYAYAIVRKKGMEDAQ